MIRIRPVLALLVAAACIGCRSVANHRPQAASLALVGAKVVDLSNGVATPSTVLIVDSRISAVGPAADIAIPSTARVIDVTGAYLIPGLWDMHAHTTYATTAEIERVLFPSLVAHGVLGIRDLGSRFPAEQTRRWRKAIANGRLLGPRLAALGRIVDARPTSPGTLLVRGEAEARAAVTNVLRDGYDFVKPYNDLTRAAYDALMEEAGQRNLTVAGHLPYAVSASEASDLGQQSIEHLSNLWYEVAGAEERIRGRILRGIAEGESPVALFEAKIDSLFPLAFETYDARKEHELFARLIRNGTWQVPTLVVDRYYVRSASRGDEWADTTDWRLLPKWVRESGRVLDRFLANLTAEQRGTLIELYRREAAMVGRMQRAGVGILAGSDAPASYLTPGSALHAELEALVQDAGLTALEALRTATVNPASFLGVADSLGAVRPGMVADLVLLEADPTSDIRHIRRIRGVVTRGRFQDRSALDSLLIRAEQAVARQ